MRERGRQGPLRRPESAMHPAVPRRGGHRWSRPGSSGRSDTTGVRRSSGSSGPAEGSSGPLVGLMTAGATHTVSDGGRWWSPEPTPAHPNGVSAPRSVCVPDGPSEPRREPGTSGRTRRDNGSGRDRADRPEGRPPFGWSRGRWPGDHPKGTASPPAGGAGCRARWGRRGVAYGGGCGRVRPFSATGYKPYRFRPRRRVRRHWGLVGGPSDRWPIPVGRVGRAPGRAPPARPPA